ncbi:MAG: VWA domain-containing protein [Pyrinomonadaceae bacterium]
MRRTLALLASLVVCYASLAPAFAQQPTQTPTPSTPAPAPQPPAGAQPPQPSPEDDEVVRVNINLVQLDAVVTDRDGRQVTNLRPEDFEIFEDGSPQQITHFAYVSAEPTAPAPTNSDAPAPTDRLAAPPVLKPLRPSEVRRTIALVFDDLNTSSESIPPLRAALRKYVEEQVRPGDLVAIVRTGGGAGALQQFTNDRRQLLAAVERVRWNPCSSRGLYITAPVRDPRDLTIPDNEICGGNRPVQGALGVLKFLLGGMRELAGRKSLVIFSDSLPIETEEENNSAMVRASAPTSLSRSASGSAPSSEDEGDSTDGSASYAYLYQRVAEAANRASVVIYGVDTRGLPTLMPSAIDHTSGMGGRQMGALLSARSLDMVRGREGQKLLASETGGFVVYNNNDINLALRRIAEDLKGYYLIGYRPAAQTFDRRFHKFGVRLKNQHGLTVRTRRGFYGVSEEESRPPARSLEDRLRLALMSPFGAGDIPVRVTALFGDAPPAGSFVRSLVHVEASALTFEDVPDGWHKAVIDVGGIAFGDNGRIVTERRRTETLSLRGKTYERALRDGIDFTLDLPLKRPGAYQVRVAVRDSATARLGAAGQFVEVPALSSGQLALSGLVINGSREAAKISPNTSQPVRAGGDSNARDDDEGDAQANPAVRRFRPQSSLNYVYVVYNARLDRQNGQPRLTARMRILRDGKEVFASADAPLAAAQGDPTRLLAAGSLRLGAGSQPGDYLLQIVVTDALADPKHRAATQWIDFEIVK